MAGNEKEATLRFKIQQVGEKYLDDLISKFTSVKAIAVAAFAAISAAIVGSIANYREQEEATNKLSQAMVNAGIYTVELKDQYLEQASALQKLTTFGDEQIINAQAILQQQLGQTEVTRELVLATLDLAQNTGDLNSAAMTVGKSIGSNTNALARQGIEIDTNASKTEKLAQVVEGLNSKYGGQAQAAAQGLGVYSQLSHAVSDLSEKFGEQLAPIASIVGQQLLRLTTEYLAPTAEFFGTVFTKSIDVAMLSLTGFSTLIESIGAALGTTIAFLYESFVASISMNFSKLKELGTSYMSQMAAEQKAIYAKSAEDINKITDDLMGNEDAKRQADLQKVQEAAIKKAELEKQARLEEAVSKQEDMIAQQESELALIGANDAQKLALQMKLLDEQIKNETDAAEKIKLLKQKSAILDQQIQLKTKENQDKINDQKLQGYSTFFGGVAALQNSSSKSLGAVAKGAAIAQATIDTYRAVMNAYANVPYPANIPAAAGMAVAGAANVAKIAGVQLAEGGIVKATPGGIQATIGEGGRDEAVIPLEDGQIPGSKQGNTFIFNGPVMGDENQAMEFAKAIDRNLLRLRQTNQAVAFDADLI